MKNINPKCLSFKELSYSATGYILPCCWADNPLALVVPMAIDPKIRILCEMDLSPGTSITPFNVFLCFE